MGNEKLVPDAAPENSRASKAKKRKHATSSDMEDEDEELEVDFDFCDPQEDDFHLIKSLLVKYLDVEELDTSALSDLIIEEAQVSSVIRCSDECVGVAAILPLREFGENSAVKQIKDYWTKKLLPAEAEDKELSRAIQSLGTALFISERILNAPPELATPLVAGLVKEVSQLTGDPELKTYVSFDDLVHCATAYVDSGTSAHDLGAVPVTGPSDITGTGSVGELVFVRPEDEFLYKRAHCSKQWDVPNKGHYSKHMRRVRVLMAVTQDQFKHALTDMASLFEHDLSQHGL